MHVEAIAEIQNFSTSRVLLIKRFALPNAFYVILYNPGCHEVFMYNLVNRESKESVSFHDDAGDVRMDVDNEDSTCFERNWDFTFVTSVYVSFPVYFVIYANNKIWAIGRYELMNFDALRQEYEYGRESQVVQSVMHTSQKCAATVYPHNSSYKPQTYEEIDRRTIPSVKQNPISYVNTCITNCLLVCRTDASGGFWSVDVIMGDQKSIRLAVVQFPNENFLKQITKFQFGPVATSPNLEPVVLCVGVEGVEEIESDEILTKKSFACFFGPETLHSLNAVILFGVPDGRVLWCLLPVHSFYLPDGELLEFRMLCDIEQPVCGIHVFPYGNGTAGDSFLIVGSLGKVLILSSFAKNGTFAMQQRIEAFTSYIPPPVYAHTIVNSSICHTSTNGQLWISKPQDTCDTLQTSKFDFTSRVTDFKQIMAISCVIANEEIFLCVSSDGIVFLGTLKPRNEIDCMTAEQIPYLIDNCYENSSHLQSLEYAKLKLTSLFSQMSIMTSILEGKLQENTISATVSQIYDHFLIQVSFHCLQFWNLDSDFWQLCVSVSRCYGQSLKSLKRTVPFNPDELTLSVEAEAPFSLFSTCTSLPWYIEAGLVLSVPDEWQTIDCLKSLSLRFPLYIQFKSIVVHELYMSHAKKQYVECVNKTVFKHTRNDAFSTILKVLQSKTFVKKRTTELSIAEDMFPTEFIFHLSLETLSKLEAYKGNNVCSHLFEMLSSNSDSADGFVKQSLICLGHRITVITSKNSSHLRVILSTDCFKLLVGLKFAISHVLMSVDRKSNTSSKYITISPGVFESLEQISRRVIYLLCDEKNLKSEKLIEDVLLSYKYIRENISTKFYFL